MSDIENAANTGNLADFVTNEGVNPNWNWEDNLWTPLYTHRYDVQIQNLLNQLWSSCSVYWNEETPIFQSIQNIARSWGEFGNWMMENNRLEFVTRFPQFIPLFNNIHGHFVWLSQLAIFDIPDFLSQGQLGIYTRSGFRTNMQLRMSDLNRDLDRLNDDVSRNLREASEEAEISRLFFNDPNNFDSEGNPIFDLDADADDNYNWDGDFFPDTNVDSSYASETESVFDTAREITIDYESDSGMVYPIQVEAREDSSVTDYESDN